MPTPPVPTYQRYAELTGNQNFKTACASITQNGTPPLASPTTPFGEGLAIAYTSASDSYAITGDGVASTFGPADVDPAAPATVRGYRKTVNGFPERFTIGRPSAGGTLLDYARGSFLTISKFGLTTQYQCVFGVPTLVTDVPTGTTFSFAKAGFNGTAHVADGSGQKIYSLTDSVVTLSANLTTGKVIATIRLVGTLQTPTGPSTTGVALGSFTASADIDTSKPTYYGALTSADRNSVFSYIGGWFFGPQGAEAAASVEIATNDPGSRMTVLGNLLAIRQ